MTQTLSPTTRRDFLRALFAVPVSLALTACGLRATESDTAQPTTAVATDATSTPVEEAAAPTETTAAPAETTAAPTETVAPTAEQSAALPPTPACGDDDDVTPPQTEGPFFTPNTPERTSLLEPGMAGTKLVLTGSVLATDCRSLAGALLDFWHADDAGQYDNVGYLLRGHQFADENGRYTLETIVPGLYPGRTRHIHVKVQAANQPVLTTQLYFPGEPGNAQDGIYRPELEMAVQDAAEGQTAGFDFVLEVG